ncbi:mannose-1-phosphate guanyltransferase [Solemya velum gill symbiont]|uniref:Mannose-1-phosphate guanyltransferase n=1 Tax=Solemya velum gill symbiont TaxID=2340 RepID=A0A0B0HDU2_SOVGS|nr:NDP-sugar synthase [Solemya velum gill symbiont]KHF25631.1 nucleoside-diphosphate-sugar pyrophosphorylase, gamma/epsilon subunit [Solemya velum gill symbiont]OOY35760.1 mannose-1-phosphate guanyltransferase [Solemya velum gill symbiont]OOY38388.1 mannose-1-phosphate guanyltransferase [Solemya velum gill symbiont]OOY40986.1 mannose-1-phosphate guanyltransferase [Solemya velum gill symbiont]OOY45432.1 mannose-1-phosphate guanyltransferase [Solemya velum gill symbiont]
MKAMILAAGKGTRVQPITHEIPKPMIPVINQPVMELIISHLKTHGFSDFIVNVSHLAQHIEDYFKDGSRLGVNMAYSWEGHFDGDEWVGQAMGSAGGMRLIQDRTGFFDSTFAVLCGDAVIDVDFSEALAFHREKGSIATIIMKQVPRDEVSSYGVVVTDDDGRVESFQEKPAPEEAKSDVVNTGIYIFEPEIFNFIPSEGEYDIGSELFPALVEAGAPFYGVTLPFQWIDIGTTPDLWDATEMALNNEIHGFTIPGEEVSPGVYTGANVLIEEGADIKGPVYIGGSTVIRKDAVVHGPALIHSGCVIESDAEIRNSIVWHHTRISGGATLDMKIVFGPHCIDFAGNVVHLGEGGFDWLISDVRSKSVSESPLK